MKTPNEYAQLSQQARQLGAAIRPDPGTPCADMLNEAVVYLNMAATKIQAVAEYNAEKGKARATS